MKAVIFLRQLVATVLASALALAEANQIKSAQDSIGQLVRLASKDIADEIARVREPMQESDALNRLIVALEPQWPSIREKVSQIATDNLTKATLFRAAEELPAGMYLEALENALTLAETGEFGSPDCLDLLYPTGDGIGSRFNFLGDNYNHPRIRRVLSRFHRLLAGTSDLRLPQKSSLKKKDILKRLADIESGADYRSHLRVAQVPLKTEKGPPIAILNKAGSGLTSRRIPPEARLESALTIAEAEYKEKWNRAYVTRDVFETPIWSDLAAVLRKSPPRDAAAFVKVAPTQVRRWLLMQAAALLPVKDHLAMMELLVAAMKPGRLKKDEVLALLHAECNERRSLLEDNQDHWRIQSLREQIAKAEVEKLGLPPEITSELIEESLPKMSPVSGIPPQRRLNPTGDEFVAKAHE